MIVKRVLIAAALGGLLGAALGVVWYRAGGSGSLVPTLAGLVLAIAFGRVWHRRTFHRRVLAAARRRLDPSAGPPPGAEPVELPLARRVVEAGAARDWAALRDLLADDFRYFSPTLRRPLAPARYLRLLRLRAKLLTGARATVEAIVQDPQREDTAWLRMHQHVDPPRGAAYDVTWWETWRLTPERDRLRARSHIAFTQAA